MGLGSVLTNALRTSEDTVPSPGHSRSQGRPEIEEDTAIKLNGKKQLLAKQS